MILKQKIELREFLPLFIFSIFIFVYFFTQTDSTRRIPRERCIGSDSKTVQRIPKRCKGVHCVDLGESFQISIYLHNVSSIQPRTSLAKFRPTKHRPALRSRPPDAEVRARGRRSPWRGLGDDELGARPRRPRAAGRTRRLRPTLALTSGETPKTFFGEN